MIFVAGYLSMMVYDGQLDDDQAGYLVVEIGNDLGMSHRQIKKATRRL